MLYSPELLDRLQAIDPAPWAGQAFRHMFGDYPPDAENTRGARWHPPGIAAIYTSLAREGALAEAEHQIAVQRVRWFLFRLYRMGLLFGSGCTSDSFSIFSLPFVCS